MACVPQPRHMMGGGDVSWMSQFLFLLCTSREERDRASGYRKRGPKPKRLLLQVTTVSKPPPPPPPPACVLALASFTHLTQHSRVLWNKTQWVCFSRSWAKAACGFGARKVSLRWGL